MLNYLKSSSKEEVSLGYKLLTSTESSSSSVSLIVKFCHINAVGKENAEDFLLLNSKGASLGSKIRD